MEIQVRHQCPECKGTGMVQHHLWAEFWEQFTPQQAREMPNAQMDAWFEERGGLTYDHTPWGGEPVRLLPDEEIPCGECGGTGRIIRWVPLSEVLCQLK